MKSFIRKILFFSLIVSAGYLIIYFTANRYAKSDNDFMAAIADKHQRIENINEPKLVFAGGSNLPFGIDSKMIQDSLNIPVVNLGLHAGLGLDFMLNELRSCIKNGDIIILSTEYFLGDGDYNLKKYTGKIYPEANHFYEKNIIKEMEANIDNTRNHLKSLIKQKHKEQTETAYSRESFNEYGDIEMSLTEIPQQNLKNDHILEYRYWEGISKLNIFYRDAESKGIQVFFVYPAYPESKYKKNLTAIRKLHQNMKQHLLFPILGNPEDFIFADSLFFDTTYHLITKGREKRTNKIINLLIQKEV